MLIKYNFSDDQYDYINVWFRDIDYSKWHSYNQQGQYECVEAMLKHYLYQLDCTREYASGRPMVTTFPIYQDRLNDYYYWLVKITDPIQYNIWLDELINRHRANIIFEIHNPYYKKTSKHKAQEAKKKKKKDIITPAWVRQETKDLFTGYTKYIYQNVNTGASHISDNPDELEELNASKKKSIKANPKTKVSSIPLSSMCFSFKKK